MRLRSDLHAIRAGRLDGWVVDERLKWLRTREYDWARRVDEKLLGDCAYDP
jgi:hypothetical protein